MMKARMNMMAAVGTENLLAEECTIGNTTPSAHSVRDCV